MGAPNIDPDLTFGATRRETLTYGFAALAAGAVAGRLASSDQAQPAGIQSREDSVAAPPVHGTVNVRDHGAVADGVSDDYDAIVKAIDEINRLAGGVLLFPPGEYFVGRHHSQGAKTRNFEFRALDGLVVSGYGARIVVKGDFHKSAEYRTRKSSHSYASTVIPLDLELCRNVIIEGLELDGQVEHMTRDEGVVEGPDYGVILRGCQNVVLRDMRIHHFAADGLILFVSSGDDPDLKKRRICRNIHIENVRSEFNARQGVTVGHVRGAYFRDCSMNFTGQSAGTYGSHAPTLGIDLEMDYPANLIEQTSGDIFFDGVELNGNARTFASQGDAFENVNLHAVVAHSDLASDTSLILGGDINVQNCTFRIPRARVIFGISNESADHIQVSGCHFESSLLVLRSNPEMILDIDRTRLVGSVLAQGAPRARFKDNEIVIPAELYGSGGTRIRLEGLRCSRGNRFTSDLDAAAGYFEVSYDGTQEVSQEEFPPDRVVRPLGVPALDGSMYSRGSTPFIGVEVSRASNPPIAGNHAVGDLVYNSQPARGDFVGWVFTADGDWSGFGRIGESG